jgi:prolyl 4-hydroxylase
MSRFTQITPEWQEWIIENLQRGCQAQAIVEIMIDKGFDPMFANAVVFHFSSSPTQRYSDAETGANEAG